VIEPVLKHEAFLADVAAAATRESGFRLWWLGQSGFLVQWQKRHLLIDPYLSDSLTRKYSQTDKPHVRMTARVVAPERLDFIDVVTSSHHHTDHLDAETLLPILTRNSQTPLVIPEAHRVLAQERLPGVAPARLVGLDAGRTAQVGGFAFTGIPAAHETIERDDQQRCKFLGYIIQFGEFTLYHSGDTVWSEEIVRALGSFRIDLMLLPINGRNPARRVAGNLDGTEAALLAKRAGARLVIPCHYEMFEFNTASPEEFLAAARRLQQPFKVLRCGERWESSNLQ
jgi:L-ascorbate metabolism protein UlaG (beta-lactamase superfamily)